MITEDYVSFETAKLLKEKGFNEPVTGLNKLLFKDGEKPILEITHQKAMKWLREVHKIYIEIVHFDKDRHTYYLYSYYPNQPERYVQHANPICSTYEEAVEAAIKYCLENLI